MPNADDDDDDDDADDDDDDDDDDSKGDGDMASPDTWLQLIAYSKAISDSLSGAANIYELYRKYVADPATQIEAKEASDTYLTFTKKEIESLTKRLEFCIDQFVKGGNGQQRVNCMCTVLQDAALGNGGDLPDIGNWLKLYEQLNCKLV